jgi:hypothetical protein
MNVATPVFGSIVAKLVSLLDHSTIGLASEGFT